MSFPKIAFIGAGSTVFMKNIVGDILQWEALKGAHFSLMDINHQRLLESELVFNKLVSSLEVQATCSVHSDQKEALR
jgi:alpha-galactosidase